MSIDGVMLLMSIFVLVALCAECVLHKLGSGYYM